MTAGVPGSQSEAAKIMVCILGVVKYATEDFAENLCHVASKMIGQSLSSCDKIFSEIFRIGANFQRLFSR